MFIPRIALVSACLVLAAATGQAAQIEMRNSPCRLFDSRNIGAGNKITNVAIVDIATREDAGGSQGGETGCGAPSTAAGVIVNIVLLLPESGGWARFYPAGGAEPLSTTINASANVANETNGAMILVGDDGEVTLHTSISAAHFVIDLIGWIDGPGESREHANPPNTVGPRFRRILQFTHAPFGGVNPGDRFIVVDSGAVGPLTGHENEWMYYDGAGWVFEAPVDGDLAYDAATGKYFSYRAVLDTWNEIAMVP